MPLDFVPVRPDLSLLAIILYAALAFLIVLLLTPWFVRFLKTNKIGKQLRVETIDGREATVFRTYHESKIGTPTMGGILMWGAILITVLLSRGLSYMGWVDHSILQRGQVYVPLFVMVALGILGAIDDYMNVRGIGRTKGIDFMPKLLSLLAISGIAAWWFFFKLGYNEIAVPMYGSVYVGMWYIPIFIFIIVATANAVNFTDGLDGLAGGLLAISFGAFGVLAYMQGLSVLAAFCAVSVGAIAAFLWHNVPPALFFMGDTGALALGGALGVIAMMTDQLLILPFVGFVFVLETLSVIIQLTSKKLRGGKKVFRSAPIHHHFQALGWGESKVTMRLWIVGMFMACLGILLGMAG